MKECFALLSRKGYPFQFTAVGTKIMPQNILHPYSNFVGTTTSSISTVPLLHQRSLIIYYMI